LHLTIPHPPRSPLFPYTTLFRSQGAGRFLTAARRIIRKHNGNLLNVTVREVETDSDTFLRYASQPMIAFVMFFSQTRTVSGDAQMQEMTRELIDAALEVGGRYY